MLNLAEADELIGRAIGRLSRLRLSSTDEINYVSELQAELKSARVALEQLKQRFARQESPSAASVADSQRYAGIFQHALDAILVADDLARYVDVNDAACILLGYRRGIDLQSAGWRMAVSPNMRRVGAEIDAITTRLRDAAKAIELRSPGSNN